MECRYATITYKMTTKSDGKEFIEIKALVDTYKQEDCDCRKEVVEEIVKIVYESRLSTFLIWTIVEDLQVDTEDFDKLNVSTQLIGSLGWDLRNFILDVHANEISTTVSEDFWYLVMLSVEVSDLPDVIFLLDLLKYKSIEGYVIGLGRRYRYRNSELAKSKLLELANSKKQSKELRSLALWVLE